MTQPLDFTGAPGWIRTSGLRIRSPLVPVCNYMFMHNIINKKKLFVPFLFHFFENENTKSKRLGATHKFNSILRSLSHTFTYTKAISNCKSLP